MAFYFTFYLECYREEDAVRIAERLRSWKTQAAGRHVAMARACIELKHEFWYVYANPQGPGYSCYGYGEGMNEPVVVAAIIESLYESITIEPGIRRAKAGYEAQDSFDEGDDFNRMSIHLPNMIYKRQLGKGHEEIGELGVFYYRNPLG